MYLTLSWDEKDDFKSEHTPERALSPFKKGHCFAFILHYQCLAHLRTVFHLKNRIKNAPGRYMLPRESKGPAGSVQVLWSL